MFNNDRAHPPANPMTGDAPTPDAVLAGLVLGLVYAALLVAALQQLVG